jgi:hypothetical protein
MKCPKCASSNIQHASAGVPIHEPSDSDDFWWGGCIVMEGMDISYNKRCKDCFNLFRFDDFTEIADVTLPKAAENLEIELPDLFGTANTVKINRDGMSDSINTMLLNQLKYMREHSDE